MHRIAMLALFGLFALGSVQVAAQTAQTAADSEAIRQAALDCIEGYYEGDAAMEQRAFTLTSRSGSCARFHGRDLALVDGRLAAHRRDPRGQWSEIPAAERKNRRDDPGCVPRRSQRAHRRRPLDRLPAPRALEGRWVIVNVLWP